MLNSNLVKILLSYNLSVEAKLLERSFFGKLPFVYFLKTKFQNNSEFLKCQDCKRFFFTKIALKNHKYKEHNKVVGSWVFSNEEKSFNFERNYFSQKSGNFQNKNKSETIPIGMDEKSSEITPDINGIKIKSLTSKHSNEKTENEKEFSRRRGPRSTTLIEHNSTNDIKHLTSIEEGPMIENSLTIDSKVLTNIKEAIIIESNSKEMPKQRVGPSTAINKTIKQKPKKKTQNIQKEREHKCQLCKKSFCKQYVKIHIATVHEKLKPYKCHLCEKCFSTDRYVKRHIAAVHEKLKPFQCSLCKKEFTRIDQCKTHISEVHENIKPYKCHLCQKTFTRENYAKKHLATVHTKPSAFKSLLCEKNFAQKIYVKVHITTAHEGLKPYKCHLCEKKFAREISVKKHIAEVHEKLKPYICHMCEKKFTRVEHCKKHISEVHNKLKPYKCHLCEKKFSQKESVKFHNSSVH